MKNISSYWTKTYNSGIVELLINTRDKWMMYHRYHDLHYIVNDDTTEEDLKITKEELGLNPATMYIVSECQDKDQISFYYIPHNLLKE